MPEHEKSACFQRLYASTTPFGKTKRTFLVHVRFLYTRKFEHCKNSGLLTDFSDVLLCIILTSVHTSFQRLIESILVTEASKYPEKSDRNTTEEADATKERKRSRRSLDDDFEDIAIDNRYKQYQDEELVRIDGTHTYSKTTHSL